MAPNREAEVLKDRGNACKAEGDLSAAAEWYRRALELDPDYGPAIYNLGVVLQDSARFAEAEERFRRCRELDRRDRDAIFRLGIVLAAQDRHAEAAQAYREALELDAENPLLWLALARAYRALDRAGEAIDCATRALQIEPAFADAHNVLGMLLQQEGRLDAAIERYREASALDPRDAAYFNNLGCALGLKGTYEEAVSSLRRAVELRPDYFDAHRNLGEVYAIQGRRDLAVRAYATAYELAPGDPRVEAGLLYGMQFVCDWSRLDELCEARRRNISVHPEQESEPFSVLSIPSTRAEQLECASNYARRVGRLTAADRERLAFTFDRGSRKRLRVGYLSADFHDHATAHWMAELFELHDRSRFEVVAYSYGPDDGTRMRARLLRAFERFEDIRPLSHVEAARKIHGDAVDILFDLKGYTANARTEIVALRPAPIQVSFVGYPGTMGADFIDYLVADRIVAPREHAAGYSEKLVRVPGCYQVNDRKRAVGEMPSRRQLGLPEDGMVFFCFNQTYKILPGTFSSWMRILAAVPKSVFWLLDWNADATRNLRREAAGRGVDPGRLIFAPLLPHRQHLGRIAAADLLLDTLPYNAHTVTSDALWCGVPVLTCPGETFAARVAASQLTAMGMPELIVRSLPEYEAMAVRLARNPAELAALREKVARNRASCALFDTPAFAYALERGLERMWETAAPGAPPADIDL